MVGGRKHEEEHPADFAGWARQLGKLLGSLAGSVLGAASLFYVLGFVIVNLHLLSLGVRDFALDRLTYLAAGIAFLTLHVAMILLALFLRFALAVVLVGAAQEVRGWRRFLALAAYFLIVISLLGMVLNYMAGAVSPQPALFRWGYAVAVGGVVALLFNVAGQAFTDPAVRAWARRARAQAAGEPPPPSGELHMPLILNVAMAAGGVFLLVFALFFLLFFWGGLIYPNLSPAFGGGLPTPVQLVLANADDVPVFDRVGIASSDLLTEQLRLVDMSDDGLIVLLNDGNAARLDRARIASILYLAPGEISP